MLSAEVDMLPFEAAGGLVRKWSLVERGGSMFRCFNMQLQASCTVGMVDL